ncbi:hypothetical protein CAPTEDRAFT_212881 [Capitella teleta]|uniref:DDE Tnp4 domain-containing protein n=1 Tax=Capitella teleta TaxID=283909 RepID=R7T4B6_CAPTE|nr:hypothetical protein CAPTEDRAFT_212881 [Capitella teleta]|eukprot:ELT87812.1 hypothetical protein CAPTEDRAFT_212881 [Capitella teleta]
MLLLSFNIIGSFTLVRQLPCVYSQIKKRNRQAVRREVARVLKEVRGASAWKSLSNHAAPHQPLDNRLPRADDVLQSVLDAAPVDGLHLDSIIWEQIDKNMADFKWAEEDDYEDLIDTLTQSEQLRKELADWSISHNISKKSLTPLLKILQSERKGFLMGCLMTYNVCEFEMDGLISVVPSSWMFMDNDGILKCRWTSSQQKIKEAATPSPAWPVYIIAKVMKKKLDSFEMADGYASDAKTTSCSDMDYASHDPANSVLLKRSRKKKISTSNKRRKSNAAAAHKSIQHIKDLTYKICLLQKTSTSKAFFKKQNKIEGDVVLKDREISSKRVHVERIIGLAKTYKILTYPLNHTKTSLFLHQADQNYSTHMLNCSLPAYHKHHRAKPIHEIHAIVCEDALHSVRATSPKQAGASQSPQKCCKLVGVGHLVWRVRSDVFDVFVMNDYCADGDLLPCAFVHVERRCTDVDIQNSATMTEEVVREGIMCMHCRFLKDNFNAMIEVLRGRHQVDSHLKRCVRRSQKLLPQGVIPSETGGACFRFSVRSSVGENLSFVSITDGFIKCHKGECQVRLHSRKSVRKLLSLDEASEACPHIEAMRAQQEVWVDCLPQLEQASGDRMGNPNDQGIMAQLPTVTVEVLNDYLGLYHQNMDDKARQMYDERFLEVIDSACGEVGPYLYQWQSAKMRKTKTYNTDVLMN